MLKVIVKNEKQLESALKLLKSKVIKTGIIKELKDRTEFKKKSDIRRHQISKAKYVQKLMDNTN